MFFMGLVNKLRPYLQVKEVIGLLERKDLVKIDRKENQKSSLKMITLTLDDFSR